MCIRDRDSVAGPSNKEIGPGGELIYRSPISVSGSSIRARATNQLLVAGGSVLTAVRRVALGGARRPDVVVGTVPAIPSMFSAYLFSLLIKRPFIVDLRDAWPELLDDMGDWNREAAGGKTLAVLEQSVLAGFIKALTKRSMMGVLKRADTVIVTTDGHKAKLEEDFRCLKNPPAIQVIRNVFPTPCPPTADDGNEQIAQPFTGDSLSLNVVYAGTVGRAQYLTTAIEAVQIARDKLGVNVNLRIIGNGATWATCKERADSLGVSVEMHHRMTPPELAANYRWADTVLVQLAPWKSLETTVPSKTYELMTNRQHITLAAAGEVAELVLRLGAGVVVSPGDATALATAWADLARNREKLAVSTAGADWVLKEQNFEAPRTLQSIFSTAHSFEV